MKKLFALFALVLAAAVLAACGSDDSTTTTTTEETGEKAAKGGAGGGGATLEFEASSDEPLAYTTKEASTKAGKVTIEFTNPQSLIHDVAIEDSAGEEVAKTDLISDGSASTSTELQPGTYTFYCTVPGHREGGMEGTLTVE
jgi:plastocyanin